MNRNTDNPQEPYLWDKVAEEWPLTPYPYEIEIGQQLEKMLKDFNITEGAKLLEVGCGVGHTSGHLASKGYKTTLMDLSEQMIKQAKEYYQQNQLQGNFVVLDMFNISEKTVGLHDVVWIFQVFDHYDGWQVSQVLEKMGKVAQKLVVVISQNPRSIPFLLFHMTAHERGEWRWGLSILRNDLKHLAELAGLEIIEERFFSAKSLSMHMANYISAETGKLYADTYESIPEEQRSLSVLIAKPKKRETNIEEKVLIFENALRIEFEALRKTYYFDIAALKQRIAKLEDELESKSSTSK